MGIFESEEYAPDAVPVEAEQVGEVHEAINGMMIDSLTQTSSGNLESFHTESHGESREGDASELDDFIGAHSEDFRDVSSIESIFIIFSLNNFALLESNKKPVFSSTTVSFEPPILLAIIGFSID